MTDTEHHEHASSRSHRSVATLGGGDPEEGTLWEHLVPRDVGDEQWSRFEGNVAEIFSAFGMDLETPGTEDTPRRFLKALYDST